MPDGPLAAAIVLVAGLVLLAVGYLLTEGLRPGRRRHRREAERLPLFGTDQLVVRRYAEDGRAEEDADEDATEVLPQPPSRPIQRPERAPTEHRPAVGAEPHVERQNGRHAAAAHAAPSAPPPLQPRRVEPPRPSAPPVREIARPAEPPAITPPAFAPPPAARPAADRGEQTYSWPPAPSSAPAQRPAGAAGRTGAPVTVPNGPDAAFVDGETLRFALPTDGTLQFLPGRLEVIAGPDTGREVRFVRTPGEDTVQVTFGRAEGPVYRHVQLHARTVSRQHATMSLLDEHWELRNLSMTNPVVLNGRVLAHNEVAPLLVDGDRIEMGEVVFLFHDR